MALLGAEVIDRCIARRVPIERLEEEIRSYIRQARMVVDWDAHNGNVRGYGGRVGARNLAERMKASLSDDEVDIGNMARDLALRI